MKLKHFLVGTCRWYYTIPYRTNSVLYYKNFFFVSTITINFKHKILTLPFIDR